MAKDTLKQRTVDLLAYIESKNSHGKRQLMARMEFLHLEKSLLYRDIKKGPASIGKNVLKGLMLYAFVDNMKD